MLRGQHAWSSVWWMFHRRFQRHQLTAPMWFTFHQKLIFYACLSILYLDSHAKGPFSVCPPLANLISSSEISLRSQNCIRVVFRWDLLECSLGIGWWDHERWQMNGETLDSVHRAHNIQIVTNDALSRKQIVKRMTTSQSRVICFGCNAANHARQSQVSESCSLSYASHQLGAFDVRLTGEKISSSGN